MAAGHEVAIARAAGSLTLWAGCAAQAGPPPYQIIDLTSLAEPIGVVQSEARGVNETGQVVGFEVVAKAIERAILWEADGTASTLERLPGDNSTIAVGIEDDGSIVGLSELAEVVPCGPLICIFEDQKATAWGPGLVPVDLNELVTGGDRSFGLQFAWDRDGSGRFTGWGRDVAGPPFTPRGFLLENGIVTNLGALDRPVAMNELDAIVGWNSTGQDHAYLWDGGALTDLHEDPSVGGVTSRAWDVNDGGLIVGEVQFEISDPEEPAMWVELVPVKLVPEIARPQGVATAVNGAGRIVGFFADLDDLNSPFRGFIWEEGVRTELLDLVPPREGWEVLYPFDINESGWIVGGGLRNGQLGRAFLMKPLAPCPWDLDGDGAVGIADLLALLAAWGSDPGGPPDFDGDGTVGISDLLALLPQWGSC
jgi:hypothetical protein